MTPTATGHEIAVQAENLHKSYVLGATAIGALRGVDLVVKRGEFVALMGPSGCGKTTLLNLIGATDLPSRGRLHVDGVDLSGLSDDQLADLRRDRLGIVFQFHNLIPTLTARENVELPMQFKGVADAGRRQRALSLLERVGLKDRADHQPSELSGGEQQRVAIARALANQPALVLLDEPTGDLDGATGGEIIALLRDLNRREGVTLVIATHDGSIAEQSSRIVRLRDGRIDGDAPGR
ncbi:MAG: ABC transporter ATP-binding protein [Opitutaceae bacterium]|nr:ABC transporter ATP-binding protein [Opitutaceae bacterium]